MSRGREGSWYDGSGGGCGPGVRTGGGWCPKGVGGLGRRHRERAEARAWWQPSATIVNNEIENL